MGMPWGGGVQDEKEHAKLRGKWDHITGIAGDLGIVDDGNQIEHETETWGL